MNNRKNRFTMRFVFAGAVLLTLLALGPAQWAVQSTSTDVAVRAPAGAGGAVGLGMSGAGAAQHKGAPAVGRAPRFTETSGGIQVSEQVAPVSSQPLSSLKPGIIKARRHQSEEREHITLTEHKDLPDPVIQSSIYPNGKPDVPQFAPLLVNFEGMNLFENGSGVPPDTNGEVGPNHYVQMVNSALAVYSKSGALAAGPVDINLLWSNAGGPCFNNNDGDPIVMYDQLADRWLLSQFTASPPYNECIAVSQTGDPTATYWLYSFPLSNNDFPDYPHFGVWPDGYYMGVNQFNGGQTYGGPRPYVFDRVRMLNGQSAGFQTVGAALGQSEGYLMPSDLDGPTPPPAGAPNFFVSSVGPLHLYRFHVDWGNPANTSFTGPTTLATAAFTELCPTTQDCIPQPSTSQRLDGVGDRLMFRLAYRNFGSYEAMVVNQSVNAANYAGIRWYEIRNPSSAPSIFQQGTYAPADSTHRWMGSAAMDQSGDIALGFSVSSSTVYPGIHVTGRLRNDPPGVMTQGEPSLLNGVGSQIGLPRWGDYSDLTVDPTDDCTFWYTQEYNSSGDYYWRTRIASFRFTACGAPPPNPTSTPVPPTRTPVPPTQTPGGPTATPVPCQVQFSDVAPGSTFYPFVRCLACRNIMSGYPCGGAGEPCDVDNHPYFRLVNPISRGQISKIVSESAGFNDTPTGQMFQDVAPDSPFYVYIYRLAHRDILGGYPCGGAGEPCVPPANRPYFRPGGSASRGQLSKIVSNAAGFAENHTTQTFEDVPTNGTFYIWIERLSSRNILGGYPCGGAGEPCGAGNLPYFRPGAGVSRGQGAKIVSNTFFPNCQP